MPFCSYEKPSEGLRMKTVNRSYPSYACVFHSCPTFTSLSLYYQSRYLFHLAYFLSRRPPPTHPKTRAPCMRKLDSVRLYYSKTASEL